MLRLCARYNIYLRRMHFYNLLPALSQIPQSNRRETVLHKGSRAVRQKAETILPNPIEPLLRPERQDPRRYKLNIEIGVRNMICLVCSIYSISINGV
jgi:hypothetical protein